MLLAAGVAAAVAGFLAGAAGAVRAALRMGFALALLIVAVNALVVHRGETVLARLGDWPLLGQVDVTAEAIAEGATLGLRVAVALVAFAVYSACVDPDRVLRALRPVAAPLGSDRDPRLPPGAGRRADADRLRDAARLRGPGAAEVGRAPLARRLLAGSLDRAVDVAATLELRGYSLEAPRRRPRFLAAPWGQGQRRSPGHASRFDRRFYLAGAAVLAVAIAGKLLGADDFHAYPTIQLGLGSATVAVSGLLALSGLAPLRRKPRRRPSPVSPAVRRSSPPRGPGAAASPLGPIAASPPGRARV